MKYLNIVNGPQNASSIILGCMRMQAIAGTMNPEHLRDICEATKVTLTHNEWYRLYLASGKYLP